MYCTKTLLNSIPEWDSISKKLFSAVKEHTLRILDWYKKGLKINGKYLSHLRFVDDIVIIVSSPDELQDLVNELIKDEKR